MATGETKPTKLATRRKKKKGTPAQFDRAFTPVAVEIGHLARNWNALHENMGLIFSAMISPDRKALLLAVWHSPPSDRTQREMLRAALGRWRLERPHLSAVSNEIEWLLNKTEELSGKRNDALHAPLHVLMNTTTYVFNVEPNYFWGHPMAKRLQGKDVLLEISKIRAQATCLMKWAGAIWLHLESARPLPQKPAWPTRGLYRSHKLPAPPTRPT